MPLWRCCDEQHPRVWWHLLIRPATHGGSDTFLASSFCLFRLITLWAVKCCTWSYPLWPEMWTALGGSCSFPAFCSSDQFLDSRYESICPLWCYPIEIALGLLIGRDGVLHFLWVQRCHSGHLQMLTENTSCFVTPLYSVISKPLRPGLCMALQCSSFIVLISTVDVEVFLRSINQSN